jgi:RNA polymerase sigma-70 factor (ECF subfamily)
LALHKNTDHQGTLQKWDRLAVPQAGEPAHPRIDQAQYDEQLGALRRAQEGDEDAFRWLVETHQRRVYGLVIRMLGCDRHTAADISQEVFLRAFRAIESFDGRALFSTWLHKITMNLCISEYRRRRAQKRDRTTLSLDAPVAGSDDLTIDPPSHEVSPLDRVHHKDIASAVKAAVEQLPDEFRTCVLMRDMQGQSYEDIGEILDLPPGTVRSRIHRGRLILQRLLKEFTP